MKNLLREKRQELGLSQSQMANKLGIKSSNGNHTVLRWEKGEVFPKAQDIWNLKICYQLTDEELVQWLRYINEEK